MLDEYLMCTQQQEGNRQWREKWFGWKGDCAHIVLYDKINSSFISFPIKCKETV